VTATRATGQELLIAHLQLLCEQPSSEPTDSRLNTRVEPELAALLVRALRLHDTLPRGARRL
jgi:hypothetical protein